MKSSSEQLYSLIDKSDSHRIDELTRSEIKIIARSISPRRLPRWFIKPDSATDWVPLKKFLESIGSMSAPVAVGHSGPPPTPGNEDFKFLKLKKAVDHVSEKSIVLDSVERLDRRGSRRFHHKIKVTIYLGPARFETMSTAVSMTDILLSDAVTVPISSTVDAKLEYQGKTMKVKLSPIGQQPTSKFRIDWMDSPDLLRTWLLN